jgi:hypothetical protein
MLSRRLDKATDKALAAIITLASVHDKFTVLRAHKGLQGTQLGFDEDLTPAQQAQKELLGPPSRRPKRMANRATGVGPISTSTTKS